MYRDDDKTYAYKSCMAYIVGKTYAYKSCLSLDVEDLQLPELASNSYIVRNLLVPHAHVETHVL